jgi:exodeoxyribonuclease V gamma subunit
LLAARERLVLSYCGSSIKDGSERPASVCVAELLDEMEQFHLAPDGKALRSFVQIDHPLHSTSASYFDGSDPRRFSYRGDLLAASQHAQGRRSREAAWFDIAVEDAPPPSEDKPSDAPPRTIELTELARFWQHPCEYFLSQHMQVQLPPKSWHSEEQEPLALSHGLKYQAGTYLLERRMRESRSEARGEERERQLLRMRGQLPASAPGQLSYQLLVEELVGPGAHVASLEPREPASVDVSVGSYRLIGSLDGLHTGGRVELRFAKARPKDRVGVWVRHLAMIFAVRAGQLDLPICSELVGRAELRRFGDFDEAEEALQWLCYGFEVGAQRPIAVLPHASAAWGEQAHAKAHGNKRAKAEPLDKARPFWKPREHDAGGASDEKDAALRLCFRGRDPFEPPAEFEKWAGVLWQPLLESEEIQSW